MIISRRITPKGSVNEADTVEIKTVLNRLGFYPVPKYGLTPYPDEAMFEGIAAFQKSRGIPATQAMRTGGKTHAAFEAALAQRGGTRSAAGGGSGGMVRVRSYHREQGGSMIRVSEHHRSHPGEGGDSYIMRAIKRRIGAPGDGMPVIVPPRTDPNMPEITEPIQPRTPPFVDEHGNIILEGNNPKTGSRVSPPRRL